MSKFRGSEFVAKENDNVAYERARAYWHIEMARENMRQRELWRKIFLRCEA